MKGLTKRQSEILDFIRLQIKSNGYPPTIREIGEEFGIRSTNGVSDHLRALERKGFLERGASKSRALRPVDMPSMAGVEAIPLHGEIAAGAPIDPHEEWKEQLRLGNELLDGANQEVFAVTVRGDSMINAGILDGDIVFLRRQNTARKHEIVAAMIEGEATLKRYLPLKDEVQFLPENDEMSPIVVKREELKAIQILGILVGLYRKY